MDVYKLACQCFEFGLGDHLVVYEGARTPIGIEFAADDDLLPYRLIAFRLSECCLNYAALFAFGDGFGVGTRAHHQIECTEYDTLTSTRFACHDGESLVEINVEVRDKGVVAYV